MEAVLEKMEVVSHLLVNKEEIPSFKFGIEDVLTDPDAKIKRWNDTHRATVLGNGYHCKVEITFNTADGETKRVDTTIWDCDNNYIMLKSGASIPVRSISSIEFY
jgi:hypothetical protein